MPCTCWTALFSCYVSDFVSSLVSEIMPVWNKQRWCYWSLNWYSCYRYSRLLLSLHIHWRGVHCAPQAVLICPPLHAPRPHQQDDLGCAVCYCGRRVWNRNTSVFCQHCLCTAMTSPEKDLFRRLLYGVVKKRFLLYCTEQGIIKEGIRAISVGRSAFSGTCWSIGSSPYFRFRLERGQFFPASLPLLRQICMFSEHFRCSSS